MDGSSKNIKIYCLTENLDPDTRYCVMSSLDEKFDTYLAQAENLQMLFIAINDEVGNLYARYFWTVIIFLLIVLRSLFRYLKLGN